MAGTAEPETGGSGTALLRVTRGRPTADEVAVLTALLLARVRPGSGAQGARSAQRNDAAARGPRAVWDRAGEYRAPAAWASAELP
ncbi:acyl-CoA carboxylase epsilon subunit [Streptomyces sp. NPDC052109]|uniref:acyl-CoA carboxylase epsilon subunit n=1 Tax=Streptomyces sp. NPDC052109 TaxID=3155527 RepID=UPI003420C93D